MVEPITVANGILALVSGGLLTVAVVALARAARRLDDPAPARLLWIAVPLLAIASLLRLIRYGTGTYGRWDTLLSLALGAAAWVLAWRALGRFEGVTPAIRSAGTILAASAAAAVILQLSVPAFFLAIQAVLGLEYGLVGAVIAALGWRLRAEGREGLVPTLALLAGLLAAGASWVRALIILSAQAGDLSMIAVSRLVPAGMIALSALLAWPAFEEFLRLTAAPRPPTPEPGAPE